jgi:hypothetical protein
MIRWLWSRIMKWGWDYGRNLQEDCISILFCDDLQLPTPLRFKVQPATGGTIIEITHYDRKKDQERVNLHIIPDTESDMPQAIARIVTIELLKA